LIHHLGLPFKKETKRQYTTKKVSHGFSSELETAKVFNAFYTEANAITVLGIFGLIAMMIMIFTDTATNSLPILFAIAVMYTDLLDGLACKEWNCHSKIGEILDPIRDRLAVIVIFVAITYNVGIHYYWTIPAFVIFIFEIIIAKTSLSSRKRGKVLSSHGIGQIRQAVHLFCAELILIDIYITPEETTALTLQFLLTVCGIASYLAMRHYSKVAIQPLIKF
jgi:phosphatidylglycerophosphate synthase